MAASRGSPGKYRELVFSSHPFSPRCWSVSKPAGVLAVIMVYVLMAFPLIFIPLSIAPRWGPITRWSLTAASAVIGLFSYISHIRTSFGNPGTLPKKNPVIDFPQPNDALALSQGFRWCAPCQSPKPPRAHHCSQCQRCIMKMDHHCPWMNNCIGVNNAKFFAQFVFWTTVSCLYSITLIICAFMDCPVDDDYDTMCGLKPVETILAVLLGFLALIFGCFAGVMLGDILHGGISGITGIDQRALEGNNGVDQPIHIQVAEEARLQAPRTCMSGISQLFGSGPFSWCCPTRGRIEYWRVGLTDADVYCMSHDYFARYCSGGAVQVRSTASRTSSENWNRAHI